MSFLADDPVRQELNVALERLAAGEPGRDVESDRIDCKEDRSRRGPGGIVLPTGEPRHDGTAEMLAAAAACLANSGGGGLIVGVDDRTGQPIGVDLDATWLRGRIYDFTERKLTCTVEPVDLHGIRLLAVIAPSANEPIRVRGKLRHRVDGRCVEMDASTWMADHTRRLGYDWSGQASGVAMSAVRPGAMQLARDYLLSSGEQPAADLSRATDPELLRRLGAVDSDGTLTNAAALLFTAEARRVPVDYRRRETVGGDSRLRIDRQDVSVLEALADTERAIAQANATIHIPGPSLAIGQIRTIPEKSVREALANAVAHRDWTLPDPIVVDFVGESLVVQSPGAFAPGVDADRLLTTPARTRNLAMADLLRRLRIAEREGVGVDRMYREMIRIGHRPPEIVERPGPHVRCALIGGKPNPLVLQLMTALAPPEASDDVDIALIVDTLRLIPTANARGLAAILQKEPVEATDALDRARATLFKGTPLITPTTRTRRYRQPDYRFGDTVRRHFGQQLPYYRNTLEDVTEHVIEFVRQHGRIQSGDYVELFGVSAPHAGTMLGRLTAPEAGQILKPGRMPNVGRDAHYVPGPGFPNDQPTT